ncbi:hypothetical protein RhiirC2_865218 [Rhizophagus irregularis]|uniref:Protein kinase domain-containing protein n=1 Tax=Rhizophagus irregularis TaxID=588596 RepID=A0A2N1NDY5_9GLOM|nr:hypothetical protein RhiirC2_865218 [Rhizophagus irregularis]
MLMWEISSGQPPFINYEHDNNLAINIIDGMRPKIISEIPSEYKSLMEQCWDADPSKRPDTETVINKMNEIMSYYQNKPDELPQLKIKSNNVTKLFTSKIHIFKNLREPKNATEEEQEAFHSKFSIPHNIDDFGESSNQYMSIIGKSDGIFKDNKNDYNKKRYINEDDDERYDPNLCSEEQDS